MSYEVAKKENCLTELTARFQNFGSSILRYVYERNDLDETKMTCEIGVNTSSDDFVDTENSMIIYGRSREICDTSKAITRSKPGMLDKSCSTQECIFSDKEEEEVKRLTAIFTKIPPAYIKDMYADCRGNFDMIFESLLEGDKDHSSLKRNKEITNEQRKQREECYRQKMCENKVRVNPSDEENMCELPTSDYDSDDSGNSTTMELNLGQFLVKQLEKEFGDPSNTFPKGCQSVVKVPKGLARQLYGFYVESAYQQIETQQSVQDDLVIEDEAFARKLYQEEIGVLEKSPSERLQETMNKQAAMEINKNPLPQLKTPTDLATSLSKEKLFKTFPRVDQSVILEMYHANNLDYKQTVHDLINSVGAIGISLNTNISEPPLSPSTPQELERLQKDSEPTQVEKKVKKTAEQYREDAACHFRKRNDFQQKAQFYSELAKQQMQYCDMANNKAATVFLDENSKQLQDLNTLDLHYLFVKEALTALDVFIDTKINELNSSNGKFTQDLLIITGRGNRSPNGVPELKPAVIGRLKARNLRYSQMNPGLLKIKIKRNTLVTNDL